MGTSEEVHQFAQAVIAEPAASFADALNGFIANFVGWPFSTAPGFVIDEDGNRTDSFACVIHTTPARTDGPDAGGFPADGVGAVIDAIENLDLESLRRAFARIAQAKRLNEKPAPRVAGAPPRRQ